MQKLYIAFTLFILIFTNTSGKGIEEQLLRKIHANRNTKLDGSMRLITDTDYGITLMVPALVCGIALKNQDASLMEKGVTIALSIIGNTIVTQNIKRTINRERPVLKYDFINPYEGDLYRSFPSGHTSSAFCTATSLYMHFPKWYVAVPAFSWAGLVGYSRLHLGVHHPSDVLAGALLGSASAVATYYTNQWFKKRFYGKHINRLKDKYGFR